ncbi:MAG: YdeI/OmpD-associated family protein [Candidatus Saccharibacteria bacterium]
MIKFVATPIQLNNRMILPLPDAASKLLSSRGQVFATGTIAGLDLQIVIEPDGNFGHWFKLDSKLQKALGRSTSGNLNVEIEPSKDWPEPDMPTDFIKALAAAPSDVQALWSEVTPMARWEWIRWVNATSNLETRTRRVDVSISKLQSGKRRPCCFNLSACTDPDLAKNGRLISLT